MRNLEGGSALCNIYKVDSSLLLFLSLSMNKEGKGGVCGPEPDNLDDVVA